MCQSTIRWFWQPCNKSNRWTKRYEAVFSEFANSDLLLFSLHAVARLQILKLKTWEIFSLEKFPHLFAIYSIDSLPQRNPQSGEVTTSNDFGPPPILPNLGDLLPSSMQGKIFLRWRVLHSPAVQISGMFQLIVRNLLQLCKYRKEKHYKCNTKKCRNGTSKSMQARW